MKDKESEMDASGVSASSSATQGTREPSSDGNSVKHPGLSSLSPGKLRPGSGEDDGGESKLFAKGLATTSLLQIAIRNGIYQNQVANAYGGMAKSVNMPAVKSGGNTYSSLASGSSSSNAAAPPVNPLLNRRRRKHKRNLSLGAPPTAGQPAAASAETAATPTPSSSPLNTLSLDRKTFLRQKQSKQLQVSDKAWVKADPQRGCVHVHDWLTPSYPRPVLCTTDTTAREIFTQLEEGKAGTIVRMNRKTGAQVDLNGNCNDSNHGQSDDKQSSCESLDVKKTQYVSIPKSEIEPESTLEVTDPAQCYPDTKFSCCLFSDSMPSDPSSEVYLSDTLSLGIDVEPIAMDDRYGLYSGSDVETSSTCEDFSSCGPHGSEPCDSLGEAPGGAGPDALGPGPYADSPTEGPDPFESSSDDVETASTSSPTRPGSCAGGDPGTSRSSPAGAAEDGPSARSLEDYADVSSSSAVGVGGAESRPDTPDFGTLYSKFSSSSLARPLGSSAAPPPDLELLGQGAGWPETVGQPPAPGMYMQVHGGSVWRLEDEERPLKILNEYLTNLGFEDPARVQEEGMNHEIGCLIRFYFGE